MAESTIEIEWTIYKPLHQPVQAVLALFFALLLFAVQPVASQLAS